MSVQTLTPGQVEQMLLNGAILIDIRRTAEFNREHIPQARSNPLATLEPESLTLPPDSPIIFHCQAGHRTRLYAARLEQSAQTDIFILEGGINAWKRSGLPVEKNAPRPIDLAHQAQLFAGLLIIIGCTLGYFVNAYGYVIALATGAILLLSGVLRICLLTHFLKNLPWNRH